MVRPRYGDHFSLFVYATISVLLKRMERQVAANGKEYGSLARFDKNEALISPSDLCSKT